MKHDVGYSETGGAIFSNLCIKATCL